MSAIEKCTSAFIETTVDDEVVIVSLDEGKFFSLRDTGLAIWSKIDGIRDREQILAELQQEFDAPDDLLARDLDAFLAEVRSAGFIRWNR
ncbi:PqqD family protein [Erythrobacter sp. SDW2]|uniref:PqqD family protein n=1 Tax=Erythrobacter sp. SDW2 TaxID=2907154 RepID=UPI001F2C9061|nr:PqqD family protein [Erythrobacter sp. SDW2]UIP07229.1 PqqD family protein [Erythrobacter sp. SDW2]